MNLDKVMQAILGSVFAVTLAVGFLAITALMARGQTLEETFDRLGAELQQMQDTLFPRFGDFGVGHAEFHHWYETGENGGPLMRPDMPGGRCCTDDGRPAKSKYVDGNWWVYIDGRWEKVPPQRVKTDVEQPNNTAHVFASKRQHGMAPTIYCFIPPKGDM